jgi:hypothetical protein
LARGVEPIGVWSTKITSAIFSAPSMASQAPGVAVGKPRRRSRPRYSTSSTSVLFPEPETPVMQTMRASGMATSMPRRLWARALRTVRRRCGLGARRLAGIGIRHAPLR